jgi:hypothetical protein
MQSVSSVIRAKGVQLTSPSCSHVRGNKPPWGLLKCKRISVSKCRPDNHIHSTSADSSASAAFPYPHFSGVSVLLSVRHVMLWIPGLSECYKVVADRAWDALSPYSDKVDSEQAACQVQLVEIFQLPIFSMFFTTLIPFSNITFSFALSISVIL